MVGVIFYTGRLTARVEHLEQWRLELLRQVERIDDHLGRIERLITEGTE